MAVRRATLEEWFLVHQLKAIARRHFHLPVTLSIDVTALVRAHAQSGSRPPITALVIKALAELAAEHPPVNRVVFHSLFGLRILEPGEIRVNVPMLLEHQGRSHLSAVVLREPHKRTLTEIQAEIRAGRERKLEDLPIGRLFIENKNTWWNRLKLSLIHFFAWRFPGLYEAKGGGGLSVSSLQLHDRPAHAFSAVAFGPTALTVCITGVHAHPDGRHLLQLGIGFDHYALRGDQCAGYVAAFADILGRYGRAGALA